MGLPRRWDPILPKPKRSAQGRSGSWFKFKEGLRMARGIYACEQCKVIDNNLEAHHVVSVADDPSREFDPRNVRFLCVDCHRKLHTPPA